MLTFLGIREGLCIHITINESIQSVVTGTTFFHMKHDEKTSWKWINILTRFCNLGLEVLYSQLFIDLLRFLARESGHKSAKQSLWNCTCKQKCAGERSISMIEVCVVLLLVMWYQYTLKFGCIISTVIQFLISLSSPSFLIHRMLRN